MELEDMERAVKEAEYVINRANSYVGKMAYLVKGRLRSGNVSGWILGELKREMRDYNIHTGKWRD